MHQVLMPSVTVQSLFAYVAAMTFSSVDIVFKVVSGDGDCPKGR